MSDPLELMLELEWKRQHSALHGHVCCGCGRLLPCKVEACEFRATDKEADWRCYECKT
jgi:hypothetical protein